jgi:class 3 adenylate cyclase
LSVYDFLSAARKVLPMERKLAAILAADVVGYSRLMEADEPGTLTRLKALLKDISSRRSPSTTAAW